MSLKFYIIFYLFFLGGYCLAQPTRERLASSIMYSWKTTPSKSLYFHGAVQLKNGIPNIDFKQFLIRNGVTLMPKNYSIQLAVGHYYISSRNNDESSSMKIENRLYHEVLLPLMIGSSLSFSQRLRLEERWIKDKNFQIRYRYKLSFKIPLNQPNFIKDTFYSSFYNEIFINGENNKRGGGINFDRNRCYSALGYILQKNLNFQLGYLQQSTESTPTGWIQFSIHHTW